MFEGWENDDEINIEIVGEGMGFGDSKKRVEH